ncbi:MAG TPA: serine/threonine-protein kinase [Streptosporangiaceae bacterium]|jgi:hypothetical protein
MPDTAPLGARDPRALGGYEIVERLGSGAQGVVYLARGADGGLAAIKVLHGEWARDPGLRERFAQEAEAAGRVNAFCTARILGARTDGDAPYIVSEYVPGPSLRHAVATDGPYHRDRLYRLAVGTATALAAIHQAGIVHRDFKPDNVLLGPDGPRVIDFGVAKWDDAAAGLGDGGAYLTIGTPSYMAPEQATGGVVGPAADMFAWAEVIVYAATGHPPYGDDTPMAVAARLISQDADVTGVDASLRDIVAACLARDPGRRPTASEVLLRLLGHAPPADPGPPEGPLAVPPSVLGEGARAAANPRGRNRRRVGLLAGASAAVVAVVAGAAYALVSGGDGGGRTGPRPAATDPGGAAALAGRWHGTLAGSGATTRLLAVDVAADGRTARVASPTSPCRMSLRRTAAHSTPGSGAGGGVAFAGAASHTCPWTGGVRLSGRQGGGLALTARPRGGGTATARLTRADGAVPRAFAGRWRGRIAPAGLRVDIALTAGARPGTWRSPGYGCTGSLSVWEAGARRLVLVRTRRGVCTASPDALVLTGGGRNLAYRQLTASGAVAQRGRLRRDR